LPTYNVYSDIYLIFYTNFSRTLAEIGQFMQVFEDLTTSDSQRVITVDWFIWIVLKYPLLDKKKA